MTGSHTFAGPGPDAVFRTNLAAGKFVIQRCADCATYIFYPRSLCVSCGSPRLDTVEADGRATVYSTSVNRRRPEAGGPVNIALVDLIEGPRLLTRVAGIAPEEVGIGMAVRARIDMVDAMPVLIFEPEGVA